MDSYPPGRHVCARAFAILLLAAMLVVISQIPSAQADSFFEVNHNGDNPDAFVGNGKCEDSGGLCTLRAAIQEANALPGDDIITINFSGTIDLTGPLPVITSDLTIRGPALPALNTLTVRRNTGGDYRVFFINGGNVEISRLTIANGKTPDGSNGTTRGGTAESGGGIFHANGNLTLTDVTITGNRTGNGGITSESNSFGGWGGNGGGLASLGPLTMKNCTVSGNRTGNGGGAASGGSGGSGGGIYLAGPATVTNVVVDGNVTGDGATGINAGLSGGSGGSGGGLFVQSAVTLTNVTVSNNTTGNAVRGNAGDGGGIFFLTGTSSVLNSTISNNRTGNGSGFLAYSGFGGGIANNSTLTVRGTTISGNTTGTNGPSGTGGGGAGIRNTFIMDLMNSTISGNTVGASDSQGGTNAGGGISNWTTMTITNCTITGNSAFDNNVSGVSGNFTDSNTTRISNTIIAQNGPASAPEVDGPFESLGHNLIGNGDGATGFIGTDLVGTVVLPINAGLASLANNGGSTLTHALLAGSPALDAGNNSLAKDTNNNALATDQRGSLRIADSIDVDSTATVDIGAFEFLQVLQDIPDQTTLEDKAIAISFGVGDGGPGVTSVTATSNNQMVVSDALIEVTGAGGVRTLEITPVFDTSGHAVITVTVNLTGGGSAVDTFVLTVLPVNDVPFFHLTCTTDSVAEDSGPRSVSNCATGMFAGLGESSQVLSFAVTNNTNPSLFSEAPAISPSGTLTYTPAPNAFGSAELTIVLKDDGGTVNGGRDTSEAAPLTINVVAVNDVPAFTKGANQTVNEDSGFQSISNWATGISAGPNESTTQSLTFVVTNNTNSSLFQVQPTIGSFGNLIFMPAFNANGTAEITVVLKDNGGTSGGGVDTSPPQTFTITVAPVNDASFTLVPFAALTNQQTPLVFSTANFNAISVNDVDAGSDPIRVSLAVTQGTLSLASTTGLSFVTGDGVDDASMTFTGTITAINSSLNGLTFKPHDGFSGTATLQITTDDQGHNGAGGPKSSTTSLNILVQSGGRLSFNTAVYGVNENGGTATIIVLRGGGSAGTASVNYSTSNGSATAGTSCTSGVDYLGASGTFSWSNGDTSVRSFTITICNDGSNEGDETINLVLSNAGGTGSLGPQSTATATIGNDDAPVLITEEFTDHAVALDLVTQTRDPFSLTNLFNLSTDQRRRVSLFVWHLGLLPSDTASSLTVVARDDEGRIYDLPVEFLHPVTTVDDLTQVIVRLPDHVIGAPRDLRVKVTLRGPSGNEAVIKIAAP